MREHYLPTNAWFDEVEKLESNSAYTYRINDELRNAMRGKYVLRYPYKKSYYYHYVLELANRKMYTGTLSKKDRENCKEGICIRVQKLLNTAVDDYVLTTIDSNYDYGVILNQISGVYYPFQYSRTNGFRFIVASDSLLLVEAAAFLSPRAKTDSEMKRVYDIYLKGISSAEKYRMCYGLNYTDSNGDCFYNPGAYVCASDGMTMSENQIKETMTYLKDMYACHAKTMILT